MSPGDYSSFKVTMSNYSLLNTIYKIDACDHKEIMDVDFLTDVESLNFPGHEVRRVETVSFNEFVESLTAKRYSTR